MWLSKVQPISMPLQEFDIFIERKGIFFPGLIRKKELLVLSKECQFPFLADSVQREISMFPDEVIEGNEADEAAYPDQKTHHKK